MEQITISRDELEDKISELFEYTQLKVSEQNNGDLYLSLDDQEFSIFEMSDNESYIDENILHVCRMKPITLEDYHDAGSEDDPEDENFDAYVSNSEYEETVKGMQEALENINRHNANNNQKLIVKDDIDYITESLDAGIEKSNRTGVQKYHGKSVANRSKSWACRLAEWVMLRASINELKNFTKKQKEFLKNYYPDRLNYKKYSNRVRAIY